MDAHAIGHADARAWKRTCSAVRNRTGFLREAHSGGKKDTRNRDRIAATRRGFQIVPWSAMVIVSEAKAVPVLSTSDCTPALSQIMFKLQVSFRDVTVLIE